VLATAYGWLAAEHSTPWLWSVVVHESGRYTLGETVFYTSHFLREVPTVLAYSLFLLGSAGQAGLGRGPGSRWWGPGGGALAAAALLVGGALLASATASGWDSAWRDLLQYRTRDDLSGYGTHWRYHWLGTLWFGAAATLVPGVVSRVSGDSRLGLRVGWARAAWGYFLGLTLIFGLSTDVLVDVRYAGHQAREILTHGPTTLLLGVGILLAAAGPGGLITREPARTSRRWTRAAALAVVAIPLHLAVVSLRGDVMAHGQADLGLSAMVAAHYFEHTLDYLLTALLLIGGLACAHPRQDSPSGQEA
jgi:hypothetical protein